jgi:hypothetical protein
MDGTLKLSPGTWLGLILLALALTGLMTRIHPQRAGALPATGAAASAAVVLLPTLESGAGQPPAPAQDGPPHRRPTLSMPYFSFARLLRPGS